MAGDPGNIGRVTDHPNFRRAVPTPEHFLPLAYVAGLAATDECSSKALLRGYSMGSLSMSCYGVGADQLGCQEGKHVATVPGGVDPEHRSEEHTSELQSLMRISYAVFCLKKKI